MRDDGTADRESLLVQMAPALAIALVTAAVGFASLHAPPETGEMGVVFAPWIGQSEAIAAIIAAGGRVVDSGRFGNVMIAYGPDAGFAERVRSEGAWLITAARGLCAPAAEGRGSMG